MTNMEAGYEHEKRAVWVTAVTIAGGVASMKEIPLGLAMKEMIDIADFILSEYKERFPKPIGWEEPVTN
jgi:hypothetical protein